MLRPELQVRRLLWGRVCKKDGNYKKGGSCYCWNDDDKAAWCQSCGYTACWGRVYVGGYACGVNSNYFIYGECKYPAGTSLQGDTCM